ncbi:MAG TPA: carbohydrate ABC transporter permease [Erysipelothrix sp.]
MDKKLHRLSFINFILLLFGAIILLLPLVWMVSISLKSMEEIMSGSQNLIPKKVHFSNYIKTWHAAPFNRYALNTIFITLMSVIGNVLMNALIAYGFAKINFKGKNVLFVLVLTTMMIPGFVTMVPKYILYSKIGWLNTYLPLIVPAFLGSAFNIFLLRQFYMTISDSVIESAKMEGANHFQIWWHIAMPMIKPALLTIAIYAFNGAWNDFLNPLLYLRDERKYTLQIGLQIFKEQSSSQWNYLMAGSLIVLLPVLILFFVFQKQFIEGANINAQQSIK